MASAVPIDRPAGIPLGDTSNPHHSYMKVMAEAQFHLYKGRLSGLPQCAIIQLIARETLGKPRAIDKRTKKAPPPPLWVCLTYRQLANAAGCSERLAMDLIADADQPRIDKETKRKRGRGLIESMTDKEARKMGFPPVSHANAKWYRLCADAWAKAPKYEPKLVAASDTPPVDDTPDDQQTVVTMPAAGKVVALAPGQKCRPVAAEAHAFAIDNRSSVALLFEPILKAGVVTTRISDVDVSVHKAAAEERKKGEATLKRTSERKLRSEAYDLLEAGLTARGFACDDAVLARMAVDLKCPAEFFLEQVDERAKRARGGLSLAIVTFVVADSNQRWPRARAAWEARRAEAARPAAEAAATAARDRAWRAACPDGAQLFDGIFRDGGGLDDEAAERWTAHERACETCTKHGRRQ